MTVASFSRSRAGHRPRAGLFGEIDVDNFAGGGGVGMGFETAMGKAFDVAINHDPAAIAMHRANHPDTLHLCESVWKVDPVEVAAGRPVRLAWFSPDCKHFSRAKGAKPVEKKIRGLAWVAVRWAKRVRPRLIILENVREFQDWGPLTDEQRPCPARKGQTFKRFVGALRNMGYAVEWRVLNAADYGAPTHRRRLFLIARCDGRPIVWPERTHGTPERLGGSHSRGTSISLDRAGRGVGDCATELGRDPSPDGLDQTGDPQAQTHRNAGGRHGANPGPHAKAIDRGHAQQVRDSASSGLRAWRTAAECIDWSLPCPSIFDRKRPLAEKTLRRIALGIKRYVLEASNPFIVRVQHGRDEFRGQAIDQPLATVTAKHGYGVVAPSLMSIERSYKEFTGQGADRPLGTITASPKGGKHALIGATLVQTGYGERDGQAPRAIDIGKPLGTVVGGGQKHALVTAFLSQFWGGMVGKPLTEPTPTATGKGPHEGLVAAHVVKFRGDCSGVEASAPLPTITAGDGAARPAGAAHALGIAAANLTHFHNGRSGQNGDLRAPLGTVTAQGGKFGLVYAFLVKYFGTAIGQPVDAPLHTATAKSRFGVVWIEMASGTDGDRVVRVKQPAVFIDVPGVGPCLIADIGLRMLTPRELARAQGFPDSYILTGSQANQVAKIGNSVPPPIVAALVRSNVAEAAESEDAA